MRDRLKGYRPPAALLALCLFLLLGCGEEGGEAGAGTGKRAFKKCVTCHSMAPGRHLTGPSLSGIFGRKAGTVEGFLRYSDALKFSDVVWTAETLDAWLQNPRAFIPGNRMTIKGVKDQQDRDELVAFLEKGGASQTAQQAPSKGGGMMSRSALDLKKVDSDRQVAAIRYCGDAYHVTTGAGETVAFWEFNLRFKTDSSDNGPGKGKPALIPSGMQGDRAFVIFSEPGEFSAFIKSEC